MPLERTKMNSTYQALGMALGAVVAATGCARSQSAALLRRPASQEVPSSVAIYGGTPVSAGDRVALATVALLSGADDLSGFGLVDGSGTLVAPGVVLGAAHTCLNFAPTFASFGPAIPDEEPWSPYEVGPKYPSLRKIVRCVAHPGYDSDLARGDAVDERPVNDIAVFFVEETPSWARPASVAAADSELPTKVTIAGFGAHEGQFDAGAGGGERYGLRAVNSFLGKSFSKSLQFMDGPNPGKGSCQGDSGGSVYRESRPGEPLVLVGIPVNGPECDAGIGINTDVRPFLGWVERSAGVTLAKVK